ncbi:SCO family protein [Dyadobacter psychrotolerans]|uniref:SCO family protein n=1 Tax=Dyadobacter psychrotolerans TaxID=2541721 RepID=A0A4V2Z3J1_9BACT|nr:SCO family protein [Dyadobacter psychrotolerans]TDE12848.1 SCO family protein [Dyadobacter psychrotolerans]
MYQTVFLKISRLLLILTIFACTDKGSETHLPYYDTPDFTPVFLNSEDEIDARVSHTIAPFSFTDQNGAIVTEKDIEGKIHIANFIFTSCVSICPVMTKHMKILQTEFQNDTEVKMLSFSVTPWIDDVKRLHSFAEKNEITSPNWHLLTGSKGTIYDLARKSYFAEEDLGFTRDSSEFLHTEHILLIDKTKRIRGIYNGTLQLEAEQLVKDIRILQKEDDV